MLVQVTGGKTGQLQPLLQDTSPRPAEGPIFGDGAMPRRLPDDQYAIIHAATYNRMGGSDIAMILATLAGEDALLKPSERVSPIEFEATGCYGIHEE
jgi:hypothetical protein